MASRFGPAQPRGVTWNGAGGSLILSQSRHVIFSRTCWITFHWRGITSSVSVTVSPSLRRRVPPQQSQVAGAGMTTRSRAKCSGNGWRDGRLRVNGRNRRRLGGGALGGDLVLGGGGLQLFELQLHLVEKARRALRARPVDLRA